MRKHLITGLIVLNVILAIAVTLTFFNIPQAKAQPMGLSGNFLMVSGAILGSTADIVYLIDLENRQLQAIYYDRASDRVTSVGARDLIRDLAGTPESSRRRVPGKPKY
jgi:hypothetical protein